MCMHTGRFICQAMHREDLPVYVFACEYKCGYWLNFDPRLAGAHRSVKWKKFIVSYTSYPALETEWKTPQKLHLPGP